MPATWALIGTPASINAKQPPHTDGGDIEFINQNISFKPKTGDLVLFPGNMHYWYNVGPANGSRYIMPIWFDFV